jgi:hypothetical protein
MFGLWLDVKVARSPKLSDFQMTIKIGTSDIKSSYSLTRNSESKVNAIARACYDLEQQHAEISNKSASDLPKRHNDRYMSGRNEGRVSDRSNK